MAEIRKVVPSAGVSNFQTVAAEGGGAFRVLADGLNAAYDFIKPLAVQQMTERGTELGREMARQQVGDPAAATVAGGTHDHASHAGQSHADWLKYSNQGATRNDPLDPSLVNAMSFVGGMGVTMNVVSGGQEAAGQGGSRTGSTRHDHGKSADVDFYKGGRKLDWNNPEDLGTLTEIVRTAKSRGVTGIGAGNDYMGPGRFHVGFGAPAVWGAGGKSENAPSWLVEAYNGAPSGAAPQGAAPYQPPTMIREADGKLSARMYSPMAGEILQASNAAAGVAYQSEMMLKGLGDMMGMSNQFPLDPQGFQQAAQSYVDEIVSKAPEMFRSDLRVSLEREAKQRVLGMMEEQQRETRLRANNSSAALVDRWSDNLAGAIAGGNPDDIAAAQGELDGVLAAREALPGGWTPEQSENVRIKTAEAGQAIVERRQSKQKAQYKDTLSTIVTAANAGLIGADESILDNPEIAALLPEEYQRARAAQIRRDAMPGFTAAPAADRKAAIAEIAAIPINDENDVAMITAFKDADKAVTKAFEDSPIDAAEAYLPQKPPPFPDLLGDPKGVVAGLQARADYARGLKLNGHSKYTAFLSDAEAETLGVALGKDSPVEVKSAVLGMLVQGFGEDAAKVLTEAKSNDPVTLFSGMLIARGGEKSVAESALRGQAMLDEGLVQVPSKANAVASISTDLAAALSVVPEAQAAEGSILKFATAIYANEARGIDPTSEAALTLMKQSVNKALGQSTNRRGQVTGGVQKIGGIDVLLPVGVAGEDLDGALDAAFSDASNVSLTDLAVSSFKNTMTLGVANSTPNGLQASQAIWGEAGISSSKGSLPMMGGAPLDPKHYQNGNVRIVPLPRSGAKAYRMEYVSGSGAIQDVLDASGNIYQFDVGALIDATAP